MAFAVFLNPDDLARLLVSCGRGGLSQADRRIADRLITRIGDPNALPLAPLANRTVMLRAGVVMPEYPGGIIIDSDTRILVIDEVIQGQTLTKQMMLDWLARMKNVYLDTPCGAFLKDLANTAVEPWIL